MHNKLFRNNKTMITILMTVGILFGNGNCTVSAAEMAQNMTEANLEENAGIDENLEENINTEVISDLELEKEEDIDTHTGLELEKNEESELETNISEKLEWNLDLGLEALEVVDEGASMEYIQETEQKDEKDTTDLKEKIVTIKGTRFVTDTFHGVKALYRAGGNDGTNATYSCAAFVKRYYSQVYNVSVCNLLAGCTPISSKGTIRKVSSPKEGDIVATTSGSGNHWAIVKNVNNNGTITLIEQNWKWQQGGKTVARVNRKVKASACKIYRLKK